jgi:hypothetical protein
MDITKWSGCLARVQGTQFKVAKPLAANKITLSFPAAEPFGPTTS